MAANASALSRGGTLCSYAALILHEEQLEITAENLMKIIKASNNSVAPFLPSLFAKSLNGLDLKSMLVASSAGAPAAGAGAGAAVAAAGGAAPAAAEVKEAEPEPAPESESDDDIGFSLFD